MKKAPLSKKKKTIKSKVPGKKQSQAPKLGKKNNPASSIASSKIETRLSKVDEKPQIEIKPVTVKKVRTGPKKTGWWSQ